MEQFLKRDAQAGDPTTGADAAEAQPGETAARDPRSATFNDGSFESEQQERRDEELFRTATTSETLARTLSATGGAFSTQPSTANRSSAWTSGAAPAAQPSGFGSSAFSSTPDDTRRQRTEQFQQLLQGSAFSPSAPSASAFAAPSASGSLTFRDYSAPSSTSLTPAPGGFSTAPVGGRSAFSSAPTLRGLSPGLGNSAFSPSRPTIPGSAFGSPTLPDYGGTLKPRTPLTPPPTRTQQKTF